MHESRVRRLHLLHEGGVSIWLHTLSRELLESGEFERLARDSRRHRSPCPTRRSSRRRSTALTATTGSYRPRHHHPGGSALPSTAWPRRIRSVNDVSRRIETLEARHGDACERSTSSPRRERGSLSAPVEYSSPRAG